MLAKIKFGFRATKNFLINKMGGRKILFSVIYLTYKCNMKCVMCNVWSTRKSEMSTIEVKGVIDQLKRVGTCMINFSGGEPLLREDIFSLAEYSRKKGIFNTLNTNGTLMTRDLAKKIDKYFDVTSISIDGMETIHDKIRGVKGSFERAAKGFKILAKEKRSSKVGLSFVITKKNYKEIVPVFDFARENGGDFVVYLPVHDDANSNDLVPNRKEASHVLNVLMSLKKNYPSFISTSSEFIRLMPSFFEGKMEKICDACKYYIGIDSNGCLLPCGVVRKSIGCILDNKIEDLLQCRKANEIIRNCSIPCLSTCTTNISLLFRSPIYKTAMETLSLLRV